MSPVFVAARTTGTDPERHEILEIAVLASDGATLLHTAVAPEHVHTADEDALEAVGYTEGDWAPSPLQEEVARKIRGHLAGALVVGHETHLAVRFVDEVLGGAELRTRLVDTVTLIWEHLSPLGVTDLDLEPATRFLRIPYRADHSALEDARAARAVHDKLLRASAWQRFWWKLLAPR